MVLLGIIYGEWGQDSNASKGSNGYQINAATWLAKVLPGLVFASLVLISQDVHDRI
jgi:hypothetical protein